MRFDLALWLVVPTLRCYFCSEGASFVTRQCKMKALMLQVICCSALSTHLGLYLGHFHASMRPCHQATWDGCGALISLKQRLPVSCRSAVTSSTVTGRSRRICKHSVRKKEKKLNQISLCDTEVSKNDYKKNKQKKCERKISHKLFCPAFFSEEK